MIPALTRLRSLVDALNNRPFAVAIRRGLTLMIPIMIMGSFAIFINNLPIPAYQQFMLDLFGEGWRNFGGYVYQATFSIMGVCMNLAVSYSLASNSRAGRALGINGMIGALVSFCCLFSLILVEDGTVRLDWIGPLGVFIAMMTAFLSSNLFMSLCKVKRLRIRLYSNAADPYLSQIMASLFPAVITLIVFVAFRLILQGLGIVNLHEAIYNLFRDLFAQLPSAFSTGILFVFSTHLFWFFGLHGNNVLEPVAHSIFVPAMEQNQALAALGQAPTEIFTKPFFDVFVYLGGSGATLCLIAAIIIATRRSNAIKIAGLSLMPGLINVNELMIFGVPIVLNLYLLVPFLLVPVTLTLTSYAAMALGFVPLTTAAVEWTTPIGLAGYITTGGSMSGSILQIFNLAIGTLIYMPFVRMHERSLQRDNQRTLNALVDRVNRLTQTSRALLLNRRDAEGNLARELAQDFRNDLRAGKLQVHFQPQVRKNGGLLGVEALLRWPHERFGMIPPPVAVALAEETGLSHELGLYVCAQSFRALRQLSEQGYSGLVMSINITPEQLDRPALPEEIMSLAEQERVAFPNVQLEITEQAALGGVHRIETIKTLRASGFKIAMDDFGMGHSSLMYMKDFALDEIKLDGALVRELTTNPACGDIIRSIVFLCQSTGSGLVAEYVETAQQQEALADLGCFIYQGYLYSPALPFDELLEYARQHGVADQEARVL